MKKPDCYNSNINFCRSELDTLLLVGNIGVQELFCVVLSNCYYEQTSNCLEHIWEIEGVDVHNLHQSNVTKIQPGTNGVLTITFVNKKSGMRQVGTACNNNTDEITANKLCQHFGYKSGQWDKGVNNSENEIRYLHEIIL